MSREQNHCPPVMITGMGAFSAAGAGVESLWEAVRKGVSSARWREPTVAGNPRFAVCAAPDPHFSAFELRRLRRMDRSVQFAGAAAVEAWNDANFMGDAPSPDRIAVFSGTSRGPIGTILQSQATLAGGAQLWPSVGLNSTIGCLSGALSTIIAARGPCLTISAACVSGAAAIALAAQQIVAGTVDIALAGGAEAPLHDEILLQLQSAGVLASHQEPALACRPFDRARNGTVLGEGAAFLVLESLASARKRGAKIHAQLAGWAVGSEGGERTGMDDESRTLHRVMSDALGVAGLTGAQLDYINAHGTGTELNDRLEARAIARLTAENPRLKTSSSKAITGHVMGAAAALEAVICVLALQHQHLPPSVNCFEQASDCPITLAPAHAERAAINSVLSHSAGFWGNHASLVFTAPPEA